MDTALPQKFPFILDRNLAKANYTVSVLFLSLVFEIRGSKTEKFAHISVLKISVYYETK